MKDKNWYTMVLFLTGIYTIYIGFVFSQSNKDWKSIIIICLLLLVDLFPTKLPNGRWYSVATLSILYLMYSKGISASTVPIIFSTLMSFLLLSKPFYKINWYRLFSTLGIYFISMVCAATILRFMNQLPLIVQIMGITFVFENVNLLILAGIMKFVNNAPFFNKIALRKVYIFQVCLLILTILLYHLIQYTNTIDLLTEVIITAVLVLVINFLISAYNKHIYKIEESEQRYKSLFDHNPDIVFTLDLSGKLTSINPMLEKLLGYSPESVLDVNLIEYVINTGKQEAIFHIEEALLGNPQQFTMGFFTNEGTSRDLFITCGPIVVNDQIVGIYGIAKDITEQKEAEQIIHRMAYFDEITGLPNRSKFQECMAETLDNALNSSLAGLMFLDLDKFKQVNDTLGHHSGDLLLVDVSKRIIQSVPEGSIVSRLGGDEFTIILPNLSNKEEAIQTAETILQTLVKPFYLRNREIYITTSIGICIYPDHGTDVETLIKNADASMYRAKESGGNTYSVYSNDIQEVNEAKHKIHSNLHKAIEREEFYLHFQPKIDLISDRINGVEALIRWENQELGHMSPAQFISIAEESGLILSIGEWVLRTACKQNKAWQDAGFPALVISVNLSSIQLQNDHLVSTIGHILQETELDPKWLEIEITESMLLQNTQHTMKVLKEIKELGVSISIDDFGVGYSSLSYLKHFSFDYLKMDKSFIDNLNMSPKDELIISGIIKLAHSLNMKVIAEGVESNQQLSYLREQGCDGVQGYLISKPLSADDFIERVWLSRKGESR
ncbi:PAS domain S-box-containing protein/diguanylate cyclase (GGDEF) domain-containing protein [Paenibacillus sp. yr247]|uniref:sensor domain-containing protein n=1 Tax=Paenibacillus sp. yr247 TaxID=1761880 RepID=UPI00088B7B1F|nr:EAL domain-containing protein [Paenibacillus sp. yr247]SDP17922.1 PAS domain S-box-containing protein/diguanylate cyclase (GGDEF) domain-containing protein [Paenibacillus sp. yr247]